MKVKVTAHKNYLVIETLDKEKDEDFIPAGGSRIGCVLINTGAHLGMSKEADALLKTLKKSGDDIGDVSTWSTDDGRECFAWLGGFKRLINMDTAEGDNKGITDIKYITIENIVPDGAMAAIDTVAIIHSELN